MTGPVLAGIALILGLVVGAAFVFGTPILGIPIAALGLLLVGVLEVMRRRQQQTDVHEFRGQADAQKTDFTAEDRRTQVTDDG